MRDLWTRRGLVAAIGAFTLGLASFVQPATAQGLMEKVKEQGFIRIGIADNLPWSKLNPDGSITGIAPDQVMATLEKMGITKVEAIVASYGDLVPGLNAGRWDMIGASLTISPPRCEQIIYTDPFFRENRKQFGGYLPDEVKGDLPSSFAEAVVKFDKIGITKGAELPYLQKAKEDTKSDVDIVVFDDVQLAIEAMLTKRVPFMSADAQTMRVQKERHPHIEIVELDPGHVDRGSGGGFRPADRDFRDAFVKVQRELMEDGTVKAILEKYGFNYDPAWMNISGDEACKLP